MSREMPSGLGQSPMPWATGSANPADYTQWGTQAVPQSGEITGPVGRAIEDMPEQFAEVLRMTYGEGLDATEIAELLGLSPGNVRQRRLRALAYLREQKPAHYRRHPDDVIRYSRATVVDLMPYALDPTFEGTLPVEDNGGRKSAKPPSQRGDGLVMVLDVRRALSGLPGWVEAALRRDGRGSEGSWDDAIQAVLDYLNPWSD
jgi:hypothetical protein